MPAWISHYIAVRHPGDIFIRSPAWRFIQWFLDEIGHFGSDAETVFIIIFTDAGTGGRKYELSTLCC